MADSLRGMESLTDAELVALVAGGQVARAARGLERAGGVLGLSALGPLALEPDVGGRGAVRVAGAFELARRALRERARPRPHLPHAPAVAAWASWLTGLDHEELWVLSLDGRNRLRSSRRAAMGGLSGVHVAVRDVLRTALREGASAFVLVHNHPSGDPTPSDDDVRFTEVVAEGARTVGVPLLDHVVVGQDGHVSLAGAGLVAARAAPEASTRIPYPSPRPTGSVGVRAVHGPPTLSGRPRTSASSAGA